MRENLFKLLCYFIFIATIRHSFAKNAKVSEKIVKVAEESIETTKQFAEKTFEAPPRNKHKRNHYEVRVDTFSSIYVSGPFMICLKKVKKDEELILKVEIEDSSSLDPSNIDIGVKGGICYINMHDKEYSYFNFFKLATSLVKKEQSIVKIIVPYKNISSIRAERLAHIKMLNQSEIFCGDNLNLDLSSAASVEMKLKIKNDLLLDVSSASSVDIDSCEAKRVFCEVSSASCLSLHLLANTLELILSSASKVFFRGRVDTASIMASSASSGDLKNLAIQECDAQANSNSTLILNVKKRLNASSYALSKIVYNKQPQKMCIEKGGMAEVVSLSTAQ